MGQKRERRKEKEIKHFVGGKYRDKGVPQTKSIYYRAFKYFIMFPFRQRKKKISETIKNVLTFFFKNEEIQRNSNLTLGHPVNRTLPQTHLNHTSSTLKATSFPLKRVLFASYETQPTKLDYLLMM